MKLLFTLLKKVAVQASVTFTLIVLLLFLIGSFAPGFSNAVEVSAIPIILLFSVLLACANLLLGLARWPAVARIALHYTASLLTFFFAFILIGQRATPQPSALLIDFILFTFAYILLMGGGILIRSRLAREKEAER